VPGMVPEGFGLLVRPPKPGKSWLVANVGLGCAAGGLALGRIRVDKRAVLYLALEDGKRRLQSRSRRIMCSQPIPPGIHFITKAKPAEVIPMMTEFLQRHSGDNPLIILDTYGKARPSGRLVRTFTPMTTPSVASLKTPSTNRREPRCSPCTTLGKRSPQTSLTPYRAATA
jgi:hypothetical protein